MAKAHKTLTVRLPAYPREKNSGISTRRLEWRSLILRAVRKQNRNGIKYQKVEPLELHVRLYLGKSALTMHDLDNRLKDIMDALQGRIGGSKARKPRNPIIPNDSQVWRILAEKGAPPPQSHGLGHLTIRPFRPARGRSV